ncbi:MAG TPA: hypothetical protein ACFYD1_07180 [Candidatus Hypogeohydataceae bacterium YC38]
MDRIIAVLLLVGMIAFISLSQPQDSPDMVVEKYLKAVRASDYERAYTFISKSDTTIIDWLELIRYIKQVAPPQLATLIDIAHCATRQEIVKTAVEGDTAVVEIHSVVPDMEESLKVTHKVEEIKSLLAQGALPMRERLGACELVVEEGVWKISMVRGVSAGQAAEIATDLAEQILGKDEAERLAQKIKEFGQRRAEGT